MVGPKLTRATPEPGEPGWLTPRRLRCVTVALLATAVLVAGAFSGASS